MIYLIVKLRMSMTSSTNESIEHVNLHRLFKKPKKSIVVHILEKNQ
jgi:hypothetical protein